MKQIHSKNVLVLFILLFLFAGCARRINSDDFIAGKRAADTLMIVPKNYDFDGVLSDGHIEAGIFLPVRVQPQFLDEDTNKVYFEAKDVYWKKGLLGINRFTGGYIVKRDAQGNYEILNCYHKATYFNGITYTEGYYLDDLPEEFEHALLSLDSQSEKLTVLKDTRKDKTQPLPFIAFQPE